MTTPARNPAQICPSCGGTYQSRVCPRCGLRPDPLSVPEATALADQTVRKIAATAQQLGWTDADHVRLDLDRLHIKGYLAGLRLLDGVLPEVYPETMYEARLIFSLGLLRIARLYGITHLP